MPHRKRTKEEEAQFAAGQAFVGRREKLKGRGLSQEEATAQTEQEQSGQSFVQRTKADLETPQSIAQDVLTEEAGLEPSALQKQFESEGGFQVQEGRTERGLEAGAKVGLAPAVFLGNKLGNLVSKITGKKFTPSTTSELADTTAGKALGIGTLAAGAALFGAAAGPSIAAFVGTASGGLAASLGVSKGVVLAGGGLAALGLTGLNKDLIIDKILNRKEASEIQSSLNTVGQRAPTITGTYKAGGISQVSALAELNRLQDDLLIAEYEIQQAAILDPRVKQSGQYIDIIQDLADQQEVIRESRTDVLEFGQVYNPAQILLILEEIEKTNREERQELINKGFLSEVI